MQWGENGLTKVFRLEYQGETYYDISNFLQSSMINIYDAEGNALGPGSASYSTLINEAQIRCILVLDTEIVKSAENAPNYLIGFWQNDWQHMIHDNIQDIRILYPDLSFCITEVICFRADGTGYLRTVKTNKNGSSEIALDPFHYELTDYHGGEQYGYHGYYYKCYFQAGDVIEYQARSFDNMQTLVSVDSLTRLNNRGQIDRFMEQTRFKENVKVCAMMIDIDHFKQINDTWGHAEGDKALILVSDTLKQTAERMESQVFIGRYGGDEFTVFIQSTSAGEGPEQMAEAIRAELREKQAENKLPYELNVSIGWDVLQEKNDSLEACLARADQKLYEIKRARR